MKPTEKKRIAYDFRWKGGTLDHYVGDLLTALAAAGKDEFHFICYGYPKDAEFLDGPNGSVEFRQVSWPRYSLREQAAFRGTLKADGIQLLHCPFYVMPVFSGVPTIITIHDMIPFTKFAAVQGLGRLLVCAMYRLAARRSAAIVTVSNTSKKDIVRTLKVPDTKVTVAHCALGRHAFIEPKPHTYARFAPYFACMTARHFECKNTVAAVKAWKIFRERTGLKHRLLVGGTTTEKSRALLAEAGGREDCHLLGFVPDENLSSFFHFSEAYIIPSFYEGFGLPPLEAMAAGAPVISSTGGSLPEVCGDAALYFNPSSAEELADQMVKLCTDPELRARLITAGKVRAKAFTYAQSAARILQLYRELLDGVSKPQEGGKRK